MPETSRDQQVERFLEELAQSDESALLLDCDGTLAPFHIDRHRAFPYPCVTELLQGIMKTGRLELC